MSQYNDIKDALVTAIQALTPFSDSTKVTVRNDKARILTSEIATMIAKVNTHAVLVTLLAGENITQNGSVIDRPIDVLFPVVTIWSNPLVMGANYTPQLDLVETLRAPAGPGDGSGGLHGLTLPGFQKTSHDQRLNYQRWAETPDPEFLVHAVTFRMELE